MNTTFTPDLCSQNPEFISKMQKMPKGSLLLLFALLLSFLSFKATGQQVTISSTVPSELTVCGDSETFNVQVANAGPDALTNIQVIVDFPTGISYVPGSLSETSAFSAAELNVSNLAHVIFSVGDIPSGATLDFNIEGIAQHAAVAYLLGGNVFRNDIEVYHSSGLETLETDPYNILYGALSITNVNPQVQNIFTGGSYTRTVTLVNGGFGAISSLRLVDTHDANISWVASDKGTLNAGGTELILAGTDFSTAGDGDDLFEQNESITITQTIEAVGCDNGSSQLRAYWGCGGSEGQSNKKFAYTNIQLFLPNLAITEMPTFDPCMGDDNTNIQSLEIVNNGSGPANDIELNVFQYPDYVYTGIDISTISYTIDGGAAVSVTPTSSLPASNYTCLGTGLKNDFIIDLPAIGPGETLLLSWEDETCADDICGEQYLRGWKYEMDYTDMCFLNQYEKSDTGQHFEYKDFTVFVENTSDLNDDQIGTYTFTLEQAEFRMPEGDNPYFEVVFNIPPALIWSGNNADLTYKDGTNEWTASYVNFDAVSGELVARYAYPIPFNLKRSVFNLELLFDCDAPNATTGWVTVGMQLFYLMETGCTNEYRMPLTCYQNPQTYLHCGTGCTHGMIFQDFTIERTSFGLPDNNSDGIGDASGSINMSQVKLNRVMAGDTFETIFSGKVLTSATYPSFSNAYASSTIPNGNSLIGLYGSVSVTDVSSGQVLTADNLPVTFTNGANIVTNIDFSPATLVALGHTSFTGFVFESDDLIDLRMSYEVTGNIGNIAEQVTVINNKFYLSDVANPPIAQQFQCNVRHANLTMIGYSFETKWRNTYNIGSCTRWINQYCFMWVGGGNAGHDLFPYEYRNWGNLEEVRVDVPTGYTAVNAYFRQVRTLYSNGVVGENSPYLTPTSINGNEHVYHLDDIYESNGGTMKLADEGYYGIMYVEVEPTCNLVDNTSQDMTWTFDFRKNGFIYGGVAENYTYPADRLIYRTADLIPSCLIQTAEGIGPNVEWDLEIDNNSVYNAGANSWFYLEPTSPAIQIVTVTEIATNTVITPVNGFYQLGSFGTKRTRTFKIEADYATCEEGEVKVTTAFGCEGYPTDLASFVCPIEEYSLFLNPQPSELQVRITDLPNIEPCQTFVTMEIEMLSSKIASITDLELAIGIPSNQTITIEAGTMEVLYPSTGTYTSIADPTLVGDVYTITGGDMATVIGTDGLIGVTDPGNNVVKLRFNATLSPSLKPGETLQFDFNANRICGDALPTISLAYDPSSKFSRVTDIGIEELDDTWSVSWGDYNNDGYPDVFVTTYNAALPNHLYTNNTDGTFSLYTAGPIGTDMASSLASTWGDYDNDGDLDLFVANNIGDKNFLYRNNGNGTFTSILNDPAVNDNGYAHGTSWVDYDKDGYLDLFVAEYFSTRFNHIYHNNGDGTFTEVNNAISAEAATSTSGVWGDYDHDGLQDLFVANTEGENNSLYHNDGNGQFTKITTGPVVSDAGNSVGGSWGDYDNDGDLDLFVSNASGQNNFLYNNNGTGIFTKVTTGIIVTDANHSHGSAWIDFDNDGDLDLMVGNSQGEDNALYANNGDGTFNKVTNQVTQDAGKTLGVAWADYDNDGDLDLFVANHQNSVNFFYENERGQCQSKYCVTLEGTNANRSAIGTRVYVKANVYGQDIWQMKEVSGQTGGGIGGQNELKLIFGLGDATSLDTVIIEWASGYVQTMTNQPIDDCITVQEDNASKVCGTVFYDANTNCVQDAGEIGLPNVKLIITPGDIAVYTDENGEYNAPLGIGSYTVSQAPSDNYVQNCPANDASIDVEVLALGSEYCGNNFADTANCAFPNLSVELASTAFRIGFENLLTLSYTNDGVTAATAVTLTLNTDNYVDITEASLPWDTKVGNVITWDLGTVPPGERTTIYLVDFVAGSTPVNQPIALSAFIDGGEDDCDVLNDATNENGVSVGAFDPNDISVSPEGNIAPDQVLTYKIRFQNVGNAVVEDIRVEDVLPEGLDMSTFQMGSASHPYRFEIEGNKVVWFFDNVFLVDSIADETNSHGFITFRVTPTEGLEFGTKLPNEADIYFDNNTSIRTNTVINILGWEAPASTPNGTLDVFPNPTRSNARVVLYQNSGDTEMIRTFKLIDISGREVYSNQDVEATYLDLDLTKYARGVYFIRAISDQNKPYVGRLVLQ